MNAISLKDVLAQSVVPRVPLADRSSEAYLTAPTGPKQADRWGDEAGTVERRLFSRDNLDGLMNRIYELVGRRVPIDDATLLHVLGSEHAQEVPYGEMMVPSLDRGLYQPGFIDRVVEKINARAAKRIAQMVLLDAQTERMYQYDRATHMTRGVTDIAPPEYGGRQHYDITFDFRLPAPWH